MKLTLYDFALEQQPMPFNIPLSSQFAAITIEPLSISSDLPASNNLGGGRYIVVNPSFEIEEFWQRQLGEMKSKKISENSLLLLVVVASDASDGSIDRELKRSVRSILYSFKESIFPMAVHCSVVAMLQAE